MPHQGFADFKFMKKSVRTVIRDVASANIGGNMFIAYQELLKINTMPNNFTFAVLTYTVSDDILESIKHKFSNLHNEELNPVLLKTAHP